MGQFCLLPAGKVHVVVRRRGHEPIYGTFPNKTIARAWAQDVERKIWEKSYLPTRQLDRVPFSAIVDDFENSIVSRMRGQNSARGRLKTLCTSFGPTPIGQITSEHVIEYVDRRLQNITCETMRKELPLFSRVFRYAMKIKKLPLRENPVVTAREEFALTKMLKPGRARDRRISDEEIDRIEAASESIVYLAMVHLSRELLTRFVVYKFGNAPTPGSRGATLRTGSKRQKGSLDAAQGRIRRGSMLASNGLRRQRNPGLSVRQGMPSLRATEQPKSRRAQTKGDV